MTILTIKQLKNRVFYVCDRIALGMSGAFLGLLGLISIFSGTGSDADSLAGWLILLWIIFAISFLVYIASKEGVYYRKHVFANSNFILILIMWFSFHIPISAYTALVTGWQQVFDVTLTYLLMYITGYVLARVIWAKWSEWEKKKQYGIVLVIVAALIIVPIIAAILYQGPDKEHIAVLLIIYGICSVIIMGVSAYTFSLFMGKEGRDVLEDPPSKLIAIGLINTMIFNFVVWIILCFLVPIPGGGGGGKGKKKSRGKKSSYTSGKGWRGSYAARHSYYRRHRYVAIGAYYPRASVNYYWREAMGKKEQIDTIPQKDIESAKQKIIDILSEEDLVPRSQDLRRLVGKEVSHLVFDVALDDLIAEGNVIYRSTSSGKYWKKGYVLSAQAKEGGKVQLSEEQFKKKLDEFLIQIKANQPIKARKDLWNLGVSVGFLPRWRVNSAIMILQENGKIRYNKKFGWAAT